ncbi:uncharacterized protein LOC133240099 [Bos javanicus]|uniref:uncharacterized protein LOC133240099 n=1 Tax=Bos javanicus TaxID=9906 RepID=UPI002AA8F961|nr:uncharacterized protein LOC133240099 [Bos javanicus]
MAIKVRGGAHRERRCEGQGPQGASTYGAGPAWPWTCGVEPEGSVDVRGRARSQGRGREEKGPQGAAGSPTSRQPSTEDPLPQGSHKHEEGHDLRLCLISPSAIWGSIKEAALVVLVLKQSELSSLHMDKRISLKVSISQQIHQTSATNFNYKTPHWLGSNTELTSEYKQISSSSQTAIFQLLCQIRDTAEANFPPSLCTSLINSKLAL